MKRYPHILPLLLLCLLLAACRPHGHTVEGLPCQPEEGDGWGLLATDGSVLVPAGTYPQPPTAVVGGMFTLPDSAGGYLLYSIDRPAEPVSQRRFARIGHFFEDVTLAQETPQSPVSIIDRQGRTLFSTAQYPQYDICLAHNFSEGRALVATSQGKYGYMDTRGNMVVPPVYDMAYDFSEGLALVGITNQQGQTGYQLIRPDGTTALPIRLNRCLLDTRFAHGRLMYKDLATGQCCYLDTHGMTACCLPADAVEAYPYEHGMALYQTATGTGAADREGRILIPACYEQAHMAGNDRIALKNNGRWALADSRGELLCGFDYDTLGHYYDHRLAVARKDGRYLLVDRQGKPAGPRGGYHRIAESATASRQLPQLFVRQTAATGTPAPTGTPADTAQATPAPPATRPTATGRQNRVPRQSTMQNADWKKTGRQNPFYQEAQKVLSGQLDEDDAAHQRLILNYVEHLRTSYTTKDIDFLEQLFSENALIVVGTVIHTAPETAGHYLSPTQVLYNIKTKSEYLRNLKRIFRANKHIDVRFSDFRIMRHPTVPGIYGVSLRQGYSSDLYSDDGYLFLLWDFRDETAPKIHVRTWQPNLRDDHTPLPEDEIIDIRNFNLQ